MADLPNAQNTRMPGAPGSGGPTQEHAVDLDGFTPQELARLLAARDRHEQGALNEWTDDYKRLRFARWLYEQGQIDG